MFTDIVDSTPLVVELGDERWLAVLQRHNDILDSAIRAHRGRVVNRAGDGVLAAFDQPGSAVASALRVQLDLGQERLATDVPVHVRIGIHWIEILDLGRDLVGRGVHEAARVAQCAGTDEILATAVTLDAALGSFSAFNLRQIELRGLPQAMSVASIQPTEKSADRRRF